MDSNGTLGDSAVASAADMSGIVVAGPAHWGQLTMMSYVSALRVFVYVACMMRAFKKSDYEVFGPVFFGEAVAHGLVFFYDLLSTHFDDWLRSSGILCNVLVTGMQYLNSAMIFPYMWLIFCFFFPKKKSYGSQLRLFLSAIGFTLLVTIVDAFFIEAPVCVSKQYTGFALVLMIGGKAIECLILVGLIAYVSGYICYARDRKEAILYILAVGVRIPELNLLHSFMDLHPYTSILLRGFPLVWPVVFLVMSRR